jgi:hypothetical protein
VFEHRVPLPLLAYLLKRYAVRPLTPAVCKVIDYVANNLAESISLSQLATIVGMSPHYFSELFKQTGQATASRSPMQRHRSGTRRRISKREPFHPRLSKTRRHYPFKIPSGLCAEGKSLENSFIARSC